MKKITKYIAALLIGAMTTGSITSCADNLREEFYDPDQVTTPQYELLFAGLLTQTHLFRYEYGPVYHYMVNFTRMLGVSMRPDLLDASQNSTIFQPWTGWSGTTFYPLIFNKTNVEYSKNYYAMQLLYNEMTDEEKAEKAVYVYCSNIVRGYAFQRSTDMYDDIPYFDTGSAFSGECYVGYDTQEEIYADIMAKLKEAVDGLSNFTFASDVDQIQFNAADVLCNGSIDQWIRFANSLRLRMAMRLCHVKPDEAISTIREIINDGRLILTYDQNVGFEEQDKTHAFEVTFFRGIEERGNDCIAPETIIRDILNYEYQPGDENGISPDRHDFDPRLYAMFQPDVHNRYIGLPVHMADTVRLHDYYTDQEIYDMFNYLDAETSSWAETRLVTQYNRKTYFNFDMKFPVIHATEVHLLLAEAAVRWPGEFSDIDPAEHIKQAIDISTRFYYETNMTNGYSNSTTPPLQYLKESATAPALDETHLSDYCDYAAEQFNSLSTLDKIQYIFNQKMVDMNIMNPYEIYNEARRLYKDFGRLPMTPMPNVVFMDRFPYPDDEATMNPENFAEVAYKNNHTTPVWWSGRTETAVNTNGDAL